MQHQAMYKLSIRKSHKTTLAIQNIKGETYSIKSYTITRPGQCVLSRSIRIYYTRINSTNQGQAYDDTIHRYDSIRRSLRKVYLRAYTKVNFRQLNYQRYNRLLNKHIQGHKAFLFYITMQTTHESKITNGNEHTQKQDKHLSFAASTHISRMK